MSNYLTFKRGFKDGIPIALGYLSVSFAFGMLVISKGFPLWSPIVTSATNLTGTGQFVGAELMSNCAGFAEIACTLLIINLRYVLMSLSLSQKLSPDITLFQRCVIAFGNTDEIYGVSMQQRGLLTYRYMCGIILCAYSGWVGGTIIGALASDILPAFILSALGIALYAMFLAIIIPPARTSKPICAIILIATVISCIFKYTPVLKELSSGWVIIIAGTISSGLLAFISPVKEEQQ